MHDPILREAIGEDVFAAFRQRYQDLGGKVEDLLARQSARHRDHGQDRQRDLAVYLQDHPADQKAWDELYSLCRAFVWKVAAGLHQKAPRVSIEDLSDSGWIGIGEAVQRFKPKYDVTFLTYAVWWIRLRMMDCISDNLPGFQIPKGRLYDNRNIVTGQKDANQERTAAAQIEMQQVLAGSLDESRETIKGKKMERRQAADPRSLELCMEMREAGDKFSEYLCAAIWEFSVWLSPQERYVFPRRCVINAEIKELAEEISGKPFLPTWPSQPVSMDNIAAAWPFKAKSRQRVQQVEDRVVEQAKASGFPLTKAAGHGYRIDIEMLYEDWQANEPLLFTPRDQR